MGAFGKLPFQFQQRGEQVAAAASQAASDPRLLSQHLTKRDQDLEDYLATLKGARVSIAVFTTAGSTTIASNPSPTNIPMVFGGGTEGLEHADTLGYVPLDSSSPSAWAVLYMGVNWTHTPGVTTPGIGQIFANWAGPQTTDFVVPTTIGTVGLSPQASGIAQIPANLPLAGVLDLQVSVIDILPDILVSGGGAMGPITSLDLVSGFGYIYIVD